jgi:ribosomal protein L21E
VMDLNERHNEAKYQILNMGDKVHFCFNQDVHHLMKKGWNTKVGCAITLTQKSGTIKIYVSDLIEKPIE